jgi:hypothetical protein
MNQWSRTRKRIILSIVFLTVAVLVGVPFFLLFYDKPTCSDGAMNGDETGTDCGGSCQKLCSAESLPLILKGDPRILSIASSTYEVVALVENPNPGAEIYKAGYTFMLYSPASNIPVKTIQGSTFVPKGTSFAIFEGPFTLEAGLTPTRATVEWEKASLTWQKNSLAYPELSIEDTALTSASSSPRLSASVENLSLESVSNIDLVALISDEAGNLFAASRTYIDSLEVGEKAQILFTWPRPFTKTAGSVEIIKRVFPDRSFIR